MAISVYPDGTIVHYQKPKKVREESKQNLVNCRGKPKIFTLRAKQKRLLRGACVHMFNQLQPKEYCHFATITFSGDVPNDEKIRQTITLNFLKNAIQNYCFKGYVCVKENGSKGDLLHYHILFCAPFINYFRLNSALVSAHINCGFVGSKNCFTTSSKSKGHTVKTLQGVIRYITKYIKKGQGEYTHKCYFIGGTAKFDVLKIENSEQINAVLDNFAPTWRYCGDNFAITKHDYHCYDYLKL